MPASEPRRDTAETTVSQRYSWYVLGVLTLSQTCHGIDRAIIGLVLAPIGREFGLSDGKLGFLAGFAYGIFFAIAAIPFGLAVDRRNRRNLMAMALDDLERRDGLCAASPPASGRCCSGARRSVRRRRRAHRPACRC